jgi:hypothetical protein
VNEPISGRAKQTQSKPICPKPGSGCWCDPVHGTSRTGDFRAPGSSSGGDFGRSLCTCCRHQDKCGAGSVPKHVDHPEVALLNRTERY